MGQARPSNTGLLRGSGDAIVTTELEIYQAAEDLIVEFGPLACAYASTEASELFDDGDLEGYQLWTRVLVAIGEMLATRRPKGATLH